MKVSWIFVTNKQSNNNKRVIMKKTKNIYYSERKNLRKL